MSLKAERDILGVSQRSYFSEFLEKIRDKFWFRVLVVEDSAESRNLLRMAMDTLPCRIDFAVNGARAQWYLSQKEYDLVIVDQELPDTDGLTLLSWVSRHLKLVSPESKDPSVERKKGRIPYIVYSGLDLKQPLVMEKFFFADFIRKPTNIVSIHNRIASVLRNYKHYSGVGQNL